MGVRRVDGPGRHGPGNMLFSYFEIPEKNLLEWVTEVQQIDETSHQMKAWDTRSALNVWKHTRAPQQACGGHCTCRPRFRSC
jgi:hypothetical protein